MPSLATFYKAHCIPCGELMTHNSLGCTHCGASPQPAPVAPDITALTFGAQSIRAAERRKERNKAAVAASPVGPRLVRKATLLREAEVLQRLAVGAPSFAEVARAMSMTTVGVRAIVVRVSERLGVPYQGRGAQTALIAKARASGVLA
jgi:hypothetical protein